MANYIDLTKNTKNIPGMDIEAAMLGKFIRIIRGNGKEVIPCGNIKIDKYAIYDIEDCGNSITITKGNGWCCTQKQYDDIMTGGRKVLDDIFGDIFEKN